MKNSYITFSLLLIFTISYSQNKSTEKADKLFNILIVLSAEFRPISIPVEIPIIDPQGLLLPYVL